jgi:3-oxoacyl-[acyl-carrier protein] reductase
VGRPDDVARFAEEVVRRFGPPDVVVNNAGIVARARLEALELDAWDAVMDSNLKGTFLVTRAFLPAMRARGSGRIVNIASISGRQGTAELTAYCAAKHGVVGLTRALAEEVRADGIAVNAICPGSVDTEMLRAGLPGAEPDMSPEDVAGVVLYLAATAPPALTGSCVDVFG